ncbi:MAG: TetR/AcrR family transcriptional regulator [Microbacterium sp.]
MARPRSEKARQAVLSAMRRSLAAHGYEAVTMEGLAAEAGVAKQTIYRWWLSKAAILGEALLEGDLPGLHDAPAFTRDLEGDLRAWFRMVAERQQDAEIVAVARALIVVTATDPSLGAALNERLAAPIRNWVVSRLMAAVEAGEVREGVEVSAVAEQLLAIASYGTLLGRPLDPEQIDAVVDVLVRGLRVP